MTLQPLRELKALLHRLPAVQRARFMQHLMADDDCDLCNNEQAWRDEFGDDWCVARNLLCGPDNWACPGFPVKCPA